MDGPCCYRFITDTVDKITGDWELQGWGAELVKEREKGGCGILVGQWTFTL
jgi:hypothetical protein